MITSRTGKVLGPFLKFVRLEGFSGILLIICLVVALAVANSPWYQAYFQLLEWKVGFSAAGYSFGTSFQHLINDGLMTLFFLLVGLEIKRESVSGELAGFRKAAMPIIAALGGMIVPALIFTSINRGLPSSAGWGIPMATDIAFALGILSLLGSRVPPALKVYLTALAIIDDLGAVVVIAVFYTSDLYLSNLGLALVVFLGLIALNKMGIRTFWAYLPLSALLWYFVAKSGVHGTIAGVLAAMVIPAGPPKGREEDFRDQESPLQILERKLHPWTSFFILPLFALANAGVHINPALIKTIWEPAGMGIILGLLVGKPVGIFASTWMALYSGVVAMPTGVTYKHILGAGILGGIGFTMSIFISGLAFGSGELLDSAKLGILLASTLAGILGWLFLRLIPVKKT